MSDTFREYLVMRCNEPVTEHHDFGAGMHAAWVKALDEYDRLAPDRERAAKAVALIKRVIWFQQVIQQCGTDCPVWERCRAKSTCRYQLTPKLAEREGIIEPPAYTNGGTP